MFAEGTLIYFDPFYFKNGNSAKPKYFIVLKNMDNKTIIALLPTRKASIPYNANIEQGCLDLPDINLTCFVIPQGLEITECGKYFQFPTYLYGHQIDEYNNEILMKNYPKQGKDYIILGKIKSEYYADILRCFKNSNTVKRRFKQYL